MVVHCVESSSMKSPPIWRYLSLAKYVDLLRTRCLYFPKASLFQDETEGKWWGHAHLFENANKWRHSPVNVSTLEDMLKRAGEDPSAILREISSLIPSANEWVREILVMAEQVYPDKRREFIENTISSWKRLYDDHNKSLDQWNADISIERECTYISCWNRSTSMSLAMWAMYGGGRESVAIRSTRTKLDVLIKNSRLFLEGYNLVGAVADVEYIHGLKTPTKEVQDRIHKILFEMDRDHRIGLFAIKPSVYEFEKEVRGIIYSKRDLLGSTENLHPQMSGLLLPICVNEPQGQGTISHFIEKVYVHPMLSEDSMMVENVKEINRRFGIPELPVVANKIEALGADIKLPLVAKTD